MNTLLLDVITWDLALDVDGNIAVASNPYSQAQDAASACKLFQGELYFDITKGVPYFDEILSHAPPIGLMKARLVTAALTVPGIVKARVFFMRWTERRPVGQVQILNTENEASVAGF